MPRILRITLGVYGTTLLLTSENDIVLTHDLPHIYGRLDRHSSRRDCISVASALVRMAFQH